MRIEKENDKKNAFWAFGHKGAPNIFKKYVRHTCPSPPPSKNRLDPPMSGVAEPHEIGISLSSIDAT